MKFLHLTLASLFTLSPLMVAKVQAQSLPRVNEAKTPTIYIAGEVLQPGAYQVPVGSTWEEVLALAGGMTNKASLYGAEILRGSKTLFVGQLDRHAIPTFGFEDRDLVLVPKIKRIVITGAVKRPGSYPFPTDRAFTVADALAEAGVIGKTQKGKEPKVTLRRWESQTYSLQVLEGVKLDQPLQIDDRIEVAEAKKE